MSKKWPNAIGELMSLKKKKKGERIGNTGELYVRACLTCLTTSGGSSLRHCLSCREANECSAYDMVPYSIHNDRLELSISRALLKQLSTAWECFHMGTSLFSSLELSLSWIRLALAKAIPAQESNLKQDEEKHFSILTAFKSTLCYFIKTNKYKQFLCTSNFVLFSNKNYSKP